MTRSRPLLRFEPLEARDVPATYDLGAAADFNVFVFQDMHAFNSDVEGRVAVGGDASFRSYGIGDRLPNSNGTRDDLIVGDDLEYTNGQVFNGNIVYGDEGVLESVGIPNGDERQESDVVDFAAVEADLTATAAALGAEAPNGRTSFRHGNLTLRGPHRELNFFTVTPQQLANARSIWLMVPAGSTAVINVPGDEVSIQNLGLHLRGADCSLVLWNFYEADQITMSGIGWEGSILAPTAALDFNNGQIRGTTVVRSMTGYGQFNLCPSEVSVEIPEGSSLAGLVFLDENGDNQRDPAIDVGYEGATVTLTGLDSLGRRVKRTALSQFAGDFLFDGLWAGNYNVAVTPPQRYRESSLLGIPGTVDGTPSGSAAVNQVRSIGLGIGEDGIDYLLPLFPQQR